MAEGKKDLIVATAQDMAKNQTMVEMYKMQADIAMCMEIGYLSASNFPKLAGEIRMSANESRTLHMMTTGLMKKYFGASVHILESMIPLILTSVRLKSSDIIRKAYEKIIELASTMKKEAEDTQMRYYKVQRDIQGNISSVHVTEDDEKEKEKARQAEKEIQEAKKLEIEKEKKKFEDEEKKRKEKLEKYKEGIKEAKASKDKAEKSKQEKKKSLFGALKNVPANIVSGALPSGKDKAKKGEESLAENILAKALTVPLGVYGGILPVASIIKDFGMTAFELYGLSGEVKQAEESLQRQREKKEKEKEKLEEVEKALKQQQREEDENYRKFKELALQHKESEFNIVSLQSALKALGDVDRHLGRIALFWQDIVVVISALKNQNDAGEIYLEYIKDPVMETLFIEEVKKAEKSWEVFKAICEEYISVCSSCPDYSIENLYGFLSKPIHNESQEWRTGRKEHLFAMLDKQRAAIK